MTLDEIKGLMAAERERHALEMMRLRREYDVLRMRELRAGNKRQKHLASARAAIARGDKIYSDSPEYQSIGALPRSTFEPMQSSDQPTKHRRTRAEIEARAEELRQRRQRDAAT
jgi:hypothetical protein